MTSKIIMCGCAHKFQDKRYGNGQRVANWSTKNNAWRCTVCKREQTVARQQEKPQ